MGALWCQERDISKVTVKARSVCFKMGQKWRMVLDLTYPYTSLMTGFSFNSTIEEQLGDVNIEDLWIPYFTVTTDISISDMKIHDSGCLWRYVRSVYQCQEGCQSTVNISEPPCLSLATSHLSVIRQMAIFS